MKQFDSTIGLMVWEEEECKDSTCPSSLLESRRTWILDGPGDGVKEEGTSIISACESFIKIWHQEPCQDSTCPSSIFLESRRTWTFLMDLEMVSDGRKHSSESDCESFIKIWHQELCQDSACPPSLFSESRRTWTFLIDLKIVLDGS